jgi:hypothetical protein
MFLESTQLQVMLRYALVVRQSNLIRDIFNITEQNVLCIGLRLFTGCEKSFTLVRKKNPSGKSNKNIGFNTITPISQICI